MRWTEYTRKFLRPEIAVPFFYITFLVFAFLSYNISTTRRFLQPPDITSYLLSFLGISIIAISALAGRQARFKHPRVILAVVFGLGYLSMSAEFPELGIVNVIIPGLYALILWGASERLEKTHMITISLVAISLLASLLIFLRNIPILDALSREEVAVTPLRALFHGSAVFAAALLSALYERKFLAGILLLVVMGIASGFKSDAIAVILSALIAGILVKEPRAKDIIAAIAGVLFILTVVSTHIASLSYGSWNIPPSLYIFYRCGFTFSVFDRIIKLSLPLGHTFGRAFFDPSQEIISTVVLNYEKPHIITSTMFGPGTLDFGIVGLVLTASFIGVYLGAMHTLIQRPVQACLYAIALTHVLILIEVGLQPTSLIFLLSLFYLAYYGENLKLE
jgi:hypothetical protein